MPLVKATGLISSLFDTQDGPFELLQLMHASWIYLCPLISFYMCIIKQYSYTVQGSIVSDAKNATP